MNTQAFLIRVAICFLLSLIPFPELENRIYSERMELRGRHETAPNIVVLNLEARDFAIMKRIYAHAKDSRGKSWLADFPVTTVKRRAKADRLEGLREFYYWDPNVFREVLRKLLAQEPSSVLVTWYIPNEVVESMTEPGAELIAKNKKVLWTSRFDPEGKFMRPAGILSSGANYGFNNLIADTDGVIRRSALLRMDQPSLTRVTYAALHSDADRLKKMTEPFLINYMGPPGSVTFCRLIDLVSAKATGACANLKDKIVLLARDSERPSMESLGESFSGTFFRTPVGEMSRVEILANELHTIVNRRPIYKASLFEQSLLILAMILVGAFYIIYYPVVLSAIATTVTGALVITVLFQLIFHLFDIYVPAVNIGGSMLITYLVFTGYRLAFQENLQWRSLKQAQYLRELDQMKTNFLSLVSHDLKTPLAKIQAVVERLRREAQVPRELVDSIDNSNNELKHYITSILNLSKIESQKVILNKKSNDINRLIQEALKRLRPLATNKGIVIEERLDPLFSIECDEDLIRQVLTNLADNAIKYSPPNSKVIVRSREEEGFIRVEIEDFGPGIPKDQLPLMFRKFSRFLRPMKEQVKGTGLGLYLSKYFIELHGGTIRVKSEEGKGTTFTFTLPLHGDEGETILG